MPYGYIALVGGVALTAWFVLFSEASAITKVVAALIFIFGLACYLGWIAGWHLFGLLTLAGLSVFILLHRAFQEARLSK